MFLQNHEKIGFSAASAEAISLREGGDRMLDGLADAADPAQAFLRAAWYRSAARQRRVIGAVRASGVPVCAFPVIPRRIGPFDVAEIAGPYWPFRSVPLRDDASDAEISATMRDPLIRKALGRIWRWGPVYSDDPALARISKAARGAGWHILSKQDSTCFELDLDEQIANGPWPNGKTRRKNRARERKLGEQGEVSYRFLSGAQWSAGDRDDMAQIERNSWLAKLDDGGDTKFHDAPNRLIWEHMARDPALADMLFASLMRVGSTPVAFSFGIEIDDTRYYIANNYDERFSRQGVGKLLLYADFEQAATQGIRRVSWGSGDAGYKGEMGAEAGPKIHDLLFVRGRPLAALLRPFWQRK